MHRSLELSIILPVFNEEALVSKTVSVWAQAARKYCGSFEILCVDDGSTDRSAAKLHAMDLPELRVLHHPVNRGYGAALRTGLDQAAGLLIMLSDADLQFDPDQLGAFMRAAEEADLVCGYRAPRADPPHRRLFGAAWSGLNAGIFDLPVRDVNCAFKILHRRVAERLELQSDGAFFYAELLAKAVRAGFRIEELPVRHNPRPSGRAGGADPAVVLRAFSELWNIGAALKIPGR